MEVTGVDAALSPMRGDVNVVIALARRAWARDLPMIASRRAAEGEHSNHKRVRQAQSRAGARRVVRTTNFVLENKQTKEQ